MEQQIYSLMSKVMEDVGAVKKGDRNDHQKFNFRGIDAVINAVSPALRRHGVVVTPHIIDYQYDTVQVGNPVKNMASVRVMVRYTFHAPDGSVIETITPGESFDSGDKATAKAMSVAFRTCLIQALCLPTDETDPDADSYERSPKQAATIRKVVSTAPTKVEAPDKGLMTVEQRQQFITTCGKNSIDPMVVAANAGVDLDGEVTQEDVQKLRDAYNELKSFRESA